MFGRKAVSDQTTRQNMRVQKWVGWWTHRGNPVGASVSLPACKTGELTGAECCDSRGGDCRNLYPRELKDE